MLISASETYRNEELASDILIVSLSHSSPGLITTTFMQKQGATRERQLEVTYTITVGSNMSSINNSQNHRNYDLIRDVLRFFF